MKEPWKFIIFVGMQGIKEASLKTTYSYRVWEYIYGGISHLHAMRYDCSRLAPERKIIVKAELLTGSDNRFLLGITE